MKKISLIIPFYNNAPSLARTLESVWKANDDSLEVIVVDDASAVGVDGVLDLHRVRYIRVDKNSGPGVARNQGAAAATGEILAFTDSDCIVLEDWFVKIRSAMEDPAVVAVAGGYSDAYAKSLVSWARFLEARHYHQKERGLVNSFVAANFAVRKEVFEEVGGFPPERLSEDLLLGVKLRAKGFGVLWLPDLKVGQYFRPTFFSYFKQQFFWSHGVAVISARYPQTQGVGWSVRRFPLVLQLVLEMLLLILPFFLRGQVLLIGAGTIVAGLFAANLPLMSNVAMHWSWGKALGVGLIIVFGRNPAWLLGCLWALVRRPEVMIPGLFKIIRDKIFPVPSGLSAKG